MRPHRLLPTLIAALLAAAGLAGCGSSSSGISDAKIVDALGLSSQGGKYVMDGNAFCTVDSLLHSDQEVNDAAKGHAVIASKDGSVGIQVATPFAPSCKDDAQKKLDKLARKG
jgi:hypothetical protein